MCTQGNHVPAVGGKSVESGLVMLTRFTVIRLELHIASCGTGYQLASRFGDLAVDSVSPRRELLNNRVINNFSILKHYLISSARRSFNRHKGCLSFQLLTAHQI